MSDGKCQTSNTNRGVSEISSKRLCSRETTRGQKLKNRRGLCRESAEHSYDVDKIAGRLGLSGPNLCQLTRSKLRSLLNTLLAVRTNDM